MFTVHGLQPSLMQVCNLKEASYEGPPSKIISLDSIWLKNVLVFETEGWLVNVLVTLEAIGVLFYKLKSSKYF